MKKAIRNKHLHYKLKHASNAARTAPQRIPRAAFFSPHALQCNRRRCILRSALKLGFTAALLAITACGKSILREHYAETSAARDLAEILAGHTVEPSSVYYPLTQKPLFTRHQDQMQKLFEKIRTEHTGKILAWQKQTNFPRASGAAVYLLSGADIPNLLTFFPDCRDYLMVALQPVAHIPDLTTLPDRELENSLRALRLTMTDIAARNYFRSKILNRAKRNRALPGMQPIILAFLAGLDNEVAAYENVELQADGSLKTATNVESQSGFRVYFRHKGESEIRSLVYLNFRVDPNFYVSKSPVSLLIARLKPINLMLKAAVYLFHDAPYGDVARNLVRDAKLIVQDDSGIPLRYFSNEWLLQPFGIYTKTARLNDMRTYPLQHDLYDLYQRQAQPIKFAFGYGSWSKKSNLLRAERRRIQ